VIAQFRALRLQPAGSDGFFQPVELVEQRFDYTASSASLSRGGATVPLSPSAQLYFRAAYPMPETVDAPMVFAGYGLSISEAGYDDLAGLDVKGRVAVYINAASPQDISGALKSDARSSLPRLLAERGAVGVIGMTTPGLAEIPWERQVRLASQPYMYLADPALREVPVPFMAATFDPGRAQLLFEGSAQSFPELAALTDASRSLPKFDLAGRFSARIAVVSKPIHGRNIIARLPGRDRRLRAENVILSAHLDGLGIGEPIMGDAIYNGAFDNAVGVASVIEAARTLRRSPPLRSVLFAIVTAEEKGLLGSRYFAMRPTMARENLIADVNLDMPLPIFALKTVTPIGFEQSTLGANARAVSAAMKLPVVRDPLPDRNAFIRSDQYSFIRQGIPALFIKYGFAAGTPEEATERAWRANRYHSPQDDLAQPVMKAEAVKLNDYVAALVRDIGNDPKRPQWLPDSYFRRFAK
jgi:Zn-dependent M28 family amino/carboxypeptidase